MKPTEIHDNPSFRIIQFNVGQGDHTLIQFPDGEYAIIDFYFEEENSDLTEPPAITFFRNINDKIIIKFVCISHLDKDHIKGFEDSIHTLLNDFEAVINEIWVPSYIDFRDYFSERLTDETALKSEIEKLFGGKKISYLESDRFQRISFLHSEDKYAKLVEFVSSGTDSKELQENEIDFFAPNNTHIIKNQKAGLDTLMDMMLFLLHKLSDGNSEITRNEKLYQDKTQRNEMSVVFNIRNQFGNSSFTGDADLTEMKNLVEKVQDVSFLKGAHHGSKNSSSSELWETILTPDTPINISFSAGKKRGNTEHPDSETIEQIVEHLDSHKPICVLWTNMCQDSLSSGTKFNIPRDRLDIFEFEKDQPEFADYPDSEGPELNDVEGLLGILYDYSKDLSGNPKLLLSPGMKIYKDCHVSKCPLKKETRTTR